MKVMLSPFRFTTRYHLCCLPQQETHQRIPLLGDVSQPPVIGAGLLARNQPQIACAQIPRRFYPLQFLSSRLSTARSICSCFLVKVTIRPSLKPLLGSRRYTRYNPSNSLRADTKS